MFKGQYWRDFFALKKQSLGTHMLTVTFLSDVDVEPITIVSGKALYKQKT